MKAQTLSICIPNFGCSKNCPYCISKMTGYTEYNSSAIMINIEKMKNLAERIGISTVLLTGKGDPFYNDITYGWIKTFLNIFSNFIVEIQSNCLDLIKYKNKFNKLRELRSKGLNTIAFSIDNPEHILKYSDVFEYARSIGMVVRVTINVTSKFKDLSFPKLVEICLENHIHQLTLRNITIPLKLVNTPMAQITKNWIQENIDENIYNRLINEFLTHNGAPQLIRTLLNGASVYDFNEISFTHFDRCIQENNNEDDIRTLIFDENGHCYDSWDSQASIIF